MMMKVYRAGASVSGHLISFQGGALFRDTTSEHKNIHEHVTHDEEMMTRREIWEQRAGNTGTEALDGK